MQKIALTCRSVGVAVPITELRLGLFELSRTFLKFLETSASSMLKAVQERQIARASFASEKTTDAESCAASPSVVRGVLTGKEG